MKQVAEIFFLLLSSTLAIAPPHPNFREEHREKLRRLTAEHNDIIMNDGLDRQFCSTLSQSECRRLNHSFEQHSKDMKEIINEGNILRPLVLLVRFSDHTSRNLPTRDAIDSLWNSDDISTELPTGSIKRYLLHNSYDQLEMDASVIDWKTTDNTEMYYSKGISGLTHDLLNSTYPLLSSLDNDGYDFSNHDLNGDKIIDNLVLLHSGYPAEIGGRDCINQREFENRIWAHAMTAIHDGWISQNGFKIGSYTVASALRGTCSNKSARIGILTHELIHTWGIPDLYDTSGEWMGMGVGLYDIMSNPYGRNGDQIYPSHMSPWVRIKSGWLDPIEILQDGIFEIDASALWPSVFVIRSNFPEGEYLLIENRQNLEYDSQLKGSGLLIWHIDENKIGNSDRGYPEQSGWPGNGNHYKIAVLQADGNYDLEKGSNQGDENDFWTPGHTLCPGKVELEASAANTYPNSNSYQGGNISVTNICIFGISQSSLSMTFHVSGIVPRTVFDTPTPSFPPSSVPSSTLSLNPSSTLSLSPSSREPTRQPTYLRRPSEETSTPSSAKPYSIPINVVSSMPSNLFKKEERPLHTHQPSSLPTLYQSNYPSTSKLLQPHTEPSLLLPTNDMKPSAKVVSFKTLHPSRDALSRHSSPTIGKNVDLEGPFNPAKPTRAPSATPSISASSLPSINLKPILSQSSESTEYPTTIVWKEFVASTIAGDKSSKDENHNDFQASSKDENERHKEDQLARDSVS